MKFRSGRHGVFAPLLFAVREGGGDGEKSTDGNMIFVNQKEAVVAK